MRIIKIIGIIAIVAFLVSYIAEKAIAWFAEPGSTIDKIREILGYVATGSFAIAASCGVIALFS